MDARKPIFKQLFTGLLLAVFAVSGPLAPTAEAAVGGCRSDPLVTLSDGTILDVSAEIDTAVSNVTEIHYVIHGPRGVTLVTAVRTPILGFAGKETFTYYADSAPNQYVTETLVRTKYNHIRVTAYTTFAKVMPLAVKYKPVYGFNNQILRVSIARQVTSSHR